jgi:hypothetical protein
MLQGLGAAAAPAGGSACWQVCLSSSTYSLQCDAFVKCACRAAGVGCHCCACWRQCLLAGVRVLHHLLTALCSICGTRTSHCRGWAPLHRFVCWVQMFKIHVSCCRGWVPLLRLLEAVPAWEEASTISAAFQCVESVSRCASLHRKWQQPCFS